MGENSEHVVAIYGDRRDANRTGGMRTGKAVRGSRGEAEKDCRTLLNLLSILGRINTSGVCSNRSISLCDTSKFTSALKSFGTGKIG